VFGLLENYIRQLRADDKAMLLGGNATKFYGLSQPG